MISILMIWDRAQPLKYFKKAENIDVFSLFFTVTYVVEFGTLVVINKSLLV